MSLKQLFVCLFIAFLTSSCFDFNKPEKPENLIAKDKMVDLIIDLKLMSLASNPIDLQNLRTQGIEPNGYVFKKHNVDSLQFVLSNNYYAYYSKEYDEIFVNVIDSLQRLKAHYEAEKIKKEAAQIK